MSDFKKLKVWQDSRNFVIAIYNITNQGLFKTDYSFRDQIRRAAISIPSNIAEGDESGFNKLGIRYFYISKASIAEVETQLDIANQIGYVNDYDYDKLSNELNVISKKLRRLIQYRQNK